MAQVEFKIFFMNLILYLDPNEAIKHYEWSWQYDKGSLLGFDQF